MRSDQQHIDDFFRQKEEAWQPDTGQPSGDWEQMKALMKRTATPVPKGYRLQTTRRIIKYLGGFTVVTVITLVWLNTTRTAKKAPVAAKPATQKTVAPGTAKPVITAKAAVATTAPKTVNATTAQAATTRSKPVITTVATNNKPTSHPPLTRTRQQQSQPVNTSPATDIVDTRSQVATQDVAGIVANAKDNAPDHQSATQQLAAFYKAIQKPVQEFTISANRDTVLVGKEGTRLTIPAQTFATRKKGTANGNIQIIVREYYTYEDILSAKLTTTFGDQQLTSGGMVNIKAIVDGEEAGIKKGKEIKLQMPTTAYDENMQLFSGIRTSFKPSFQAKFMDNRMIDTVHFFKRQMDDEGNIDWIPEGQSQRLSWMGDNRRIKIFRLYDDPYRVVTGRRRIKGFFYIAPECPFSKEEMAKVLKEQASPYLDVVKVKKLKADSRALHRMTAQNVPIAGDSIYVTFNEARRQKLSGKDSVMIEEIIRKDSSAYATRLKLMNRYNFNISNMGWFNCDRFTNDPGPKVLFTYQPGKDFDAEAMVSNLVFTRYRSILPGNPDNKQISFGKVPKGEAVQLVCIGVRNGRIVACIQPVTIGQPIGDLAFEETTPEQFKKKLQQLNIPLP